MQTSDKQGLRKAMCEKRKALSEAFQKEAGELAAGHLIKTDFYKKSETIACYISMGGEIDTQTILRHIWQDKKLCYLPIVGQDKKGSLQFGLYSPTTPLEKNSCKVLQPVVDSNQLISAQELDLVILPLTAFDRKGNRLGMGGGFYDRTFAFKAGRLSHLNPWLCGFAYSFQESEVIPCEAFDIQLNAIVTEKEGIDFF